MPMFWRLQYVRGDTEWGSLKGKGLQLRYHFINPTKSNPKNPRAHSGSNPAGARALIEQNKAHGKGNVLESREGN